MSLVDDTGSASVQLLTLGLARGRRTSDIASIVKAIEGGSDIRFARLGADSYKSPVGLVYSRDLANGEHRIAHVLLHARPEVRSVPHSVFSDPSSVFSTIDEAWLKAAGRAEPGKPNVFIGDLGRAIGTNGETRVKIVVRPGTQQVVTAHPVR